jgi:hypothetical protein
MPWKLLSSEETARARNVRVGASETPDEFGTYTILETLVVANEGFAEDSATGAGAAPSAREYTLSKFDISPYLPDDTNTALYRVLKAADRLTRMSQADGYPYKQHNWCQGSDEANLDFGIDCSRSIWYAFTRAAGGGVRYNQFAKGTPTSAEQGRCTDYDPATNGYLITKDMADTSQTSLMRDSFEQCGIGDGDAANFKLGDILVYRDDFKHDGHTVMVIDPKERIAWGSHGWDGEPNFVGVREGFPLPAADIGVEYQKIKIKKDWRLWDRSTMTLRACWRHKSFIAEAKSPGGLTGRREICRHAMNPASEIARNGECRHFLEP